MKLLHYASEKESRFVLIASVAATIRSYMGVILLSNKPTTNPELRHKHIVRIHIVCMFEYAECGKMLLRLCS